MDADRRSFQPSGMNFKAEECVDRCSEGNCGVGVVGGSDRVETLDRGVTEEGGDGDNREGCLGDMGCEPSRDKFESCLGPMELSEVARKSGSPERNEFLIWRNDDDDNNFDVLNDENMSKDLCELPPVHAPPLAAVAPTDVIVTAEEPSFRVGVGLINLGNTCFLNSVLQCLVHTALFRQGLCMIDHYTPCNDEGFCLICFLRELVHHVFSSFFAIAPYPIADNLNYFSPDFMRYQQEDAHEFLQCLLDKLEKYSIFPSTAFSPAPRRNLVKEVFGGSLVSRLRCSECNHISCTPEDLVDFSLEIDDVDSLGGALESFTKLEKLEDTKLTCDGCNEKVLMEKQFVVDRAPLIASFHLKRFKNDGITVEKIGKHIDFPLTLNLQPYTVGLSEQNADLIYDLYAVIVHDGLSSDSGHYYCFVRSSISKWHEFDDSMVTKVSEYHVLSRDAYILFYAKRGTSWFSNYNDFQSLCDPAAPKYSPNSVLERGNESSESDSSTENLPLRVNREKSFSENSFRTRPAPIRPQLFNREPTYVGISDRHEKYSNSLVYNEDEDNNDINIEDSSLNFDMLLTEDDKENTNEADNFVTDKANNDRKEMADKNGASFVSEEKKAASEERIYRLSSLTNDENAASFSGHEAGHFRNKHTSDPGEEPTKSPNCPAGSSASPGFTNKFKIDICRNKTESISCQTGLRGSPDAIKLINAVHHKRSAERPVDDARQRQVLKTLKRTNMPIGRARKLLAAMNGSPIKRNKKSPVLGKKLSPRLACRKNPNRVVSPSVRSALFR